jgi:hypothetical protein
MLQVEGGWPGGWVWSSLVRTSCALLNRGQLIPVVLLLPLLVLVLLLRPANPERFLRVYLYAVTVSSVQFCEQTN